MTTKRSVRDDGWRLPDELRAKMEPLLPPRPAHPLGCHNPRVPDRAAMDAIFFVLRTGCPVERAARDRHLLVLLGPPPLPGVDRGRRVPRVLAPRPAGLRRGSRHRLGVAGARRGDGQGPAGWGGKTGPNPTDRGKRGTKRSLLTDGRGVPPGLALAGATARRWVGERTFAWLNRFRRVLIRGEKRPDTCLAMLHFALGLITWRHASLPG
jgi:transposase